MDEITISGRTVDEAIEAGLDAMGAKRAEVEIEVVDEGVKGILGLLGTRLARVRLVRRQSAAAARRAEKAARPEGPDEPVRAEHTERPARPERRERADAPAWQRPVREQEAEAGDAGAERRASYRPATPEQVERAREFVEQICRLLGVDSEVTYREVDGAVRLAVEGDQMGLLIGRRGQTLDALQYLTGLVANRNAKAPSRFVVDVEGYRDRREATLRRLAVQMAGKVKSRGHRAVLEPMTPQERRVIHMELADMPEVYTYSEGEEPYRRVVIALRDEPGGSQPGVPEE